MNGEDEHTMAVEREAASNICVFGVGGVGGYFGGKLAWFLANQSDPEWRIHLIARGPHLAEIDRAGLIPESFLALLKLAGVRHQWFDDARPALWNKYLFISAYGLVTAASGGTLSEVTGDDRLMDDVRGIMNEVAEIARGEGVPLGPNAIADALAKASGFPAGTKTSLQRDVEAGRRDEGDLFGGTIMRLGREHGIPTPFTERIYAQVRGA
jgi:2-dehydropantoate 2-reductase